MEPVDGKKCQDKVVDADEGQIEGTDHGFGWFLITVTLLFGALILTIALASRSTVAEYLAGYTVATALWIAAARRAPRRLPLPSLLIIVAALRILPLFFVPQLSGDVYRYLWDGHVAANGINPYALPPSDPSLQFLHQPWHQKINHPEIRSIYPPAAQILFLFVAWTGGGLTVWRLLLLGADLLTVRLLWKNGGVRPACWYALCPLVIFEGFWSAHIEIAAACLLVAAWQGMKTSENSAALLLALASSVKVIPVVALPGFLARATRPLRFLFTFCAALLITALPFLFSGPFMPGLSDYATRWIFNSPIYALFLKIITGLALDVRAKMFWTSIKDSLGLEAISPFVYRHLYADFITRVCLAVFCIFLIALALRVSSSTASAIANSIGALLLCSPAIHPWYWLALLPFAFLERMILWIAIAVASSVSYLLYEPAVRKGWIYLVCYGIPIGFAAAHQLITRRTQATRI
ncbi:MAG: glycosyltransferase 87 family protein [Acidobacteriota bacterium]